mgnify:CR=1 FL=1
MLLAHPLIVGKPLASRQYMADFLYSSADDVGEIGRLPNGTNRRHTRLAIGAGGIESDFLYSSSDQAGEIGRTPAAVNRRFSRLAISGLNGGTVVLDDDGVVVGGNSGIGIVRLVDGGIVIDNNAPGGFIQFGSAAGVMQYRIRNDSNNVLVFHNSNATPMYRFEDTRLRFSNDNTTDLGASGTSRPRDLFLARNAVLGGALDHDGTTVGFYGTAPITQQTGVAVTAAGIHTACVALGLFTA